MNGNRLRNAELESWSDVGIRNALRLLRAKELAEAPVIEESPLEVPVGGEMAPTSVPVRMDRGGNVLLARKAEIPAFGGEMTPPPVPITGVPQPSVRDLPVAEALLASPPYTRPRLFPRAPYPSPEETALTAVTRGLPTETETTKALLGMTPAKARMTRNAYLDFWSQPTIGRMPLAQFVQLAGALGGAFGTGPTGIQTPMARAGNVLAQIATRELERQYEEPYNVLRRRLAEAEIRKAEADPWTLHWEEQKAKGVSMVEALAEFTDITERVKEGRIVEDVWQDPETGKWLHGYVDTKTLKREKARPAHPAEIAKVTEVRPAEAATTLEKLWEERNRFAEKYGEDSRIVKSYDARIAKETAEEKEVKVPTVREHHEMIKGVPHKREEQWDPEKRTWVPVSGWVRTERPERPERPERLSISDAKAIFTARVGAIKSRMMIDMTPDEQAYIANQPVENLMVLLLAGRIGKTMTPQQKRQYRQELLDAEAEFNELSGTILERKGIKGPAPAAPTSAPAQTPLMWPLSPEVRKGQPGGEPARTPVPREHPLKGRPAGRYRIGDREVKWDGAKEIP